MVDKWCINNDQNNSIRLNENKANVILEKSIRCRRCNKTLEYSKGAYSCNTKGCKSIRKKSLVRDLTLSIVESLSITENYKEVIDNVIKEIDRKISENRKKSLDLISE
ncbi:MAG: hypothetical protein JJT76_15270 [Clostridiaceae bacterium]|nr:hypothetical protein [Clostridiaceae bacterium]